ncbi:hypothetical protein, partial [Burkholderia sp. Tr-20355]|uniref:hypothetical protein n=1 Tax=Burkholderia sp. Tr-20355 TaxID=2703895 RepID=UPI00197F09FA
VTKDVVNTRSKREETMVSIENVYEENQSNYISRVQGRREIERKGTYDRTIIELCDVEVFLLFLY